MASGIGLLRESYESLLLYLGVWDALLPHIIWGQRVVFVCLLLVATVGRRLRLRRRYVQLLDRVFSFAAAKLGDEAPLEEEVEEEGGDGGQEATERSSNSSVVICPESPRAEPASPEGSFRFQDPLPYLAAGMRAVVQDCVSKSFTSAELRTWNMLSRTKRKRYLRQSRSLTVFWATGVVIRYLFLFPMRLLVLLLSLATLVVCCIAIGLLPESDFKRRLNARVVTWCFDFVTGAGSVVARFHNPENRPTHGIAVANHTSPIDCMVLSTDQCYDMVGQKTGGILGVFMSALSKSSTHIWFERTQAKERAAVARRLREHAQNSRLPPILIFPEGCCVNNTAVMQFKKGAFELDSTIYPIAIRFDPRYGDAFWYQDTFAEYIFSMMTSWAIVVDVWYLPPMQRGEKESGVAFAQRVKALIAHRGGFVQLAWDGLVKLHTAKQDVWHLKQTQWRQKQQKEFARHFDKHEEQAEEDEGLARPLEQDKNKEEVRMEQGLATMLRGPVEDLAAFLNTQEVWEAVRPLVLWGQVMVFVCFLLVASIGRRLRLRRKYVELLDHMFNFAAFRLADETLEEEQEEEEEGATSSDEDVVICPESPRAEPASPEGTFRFQDPLPYMAAGMRAVVQDCVTKSFTSAELRTWNMLSRTKRQRYLRVSPSLTVFWAFGFVLRWVFLLPVRMLLLVISLSTLVVLCAAVGLLPHSAFKRRLNRKVVMWCFDFVAGSLSIVARFHNSENRPTHGIAVANHTSPIDSMVLATDQCYDMVGQKTRGLLGVFMGALSRSSYHIWFERGKVKERAQVIERIQEHAQDPEKPPILIYPEGICLNNTAVVQFKKGAFEVDSVIYPIAIRFDLRYGDPFWYQSTFTGYVFSMMTSWAIVCDVWYLPPTYRGQNESAAAFANRVKSQIAHRGGFVQLAWDGFVKFGQKDTESWQRKQGQWRQRQQVAFARRLNSIEEEKRRQTREKQC